MALSVRHSLKFFFQLSADSQDQRRVFPLIIFHVPVVAITISAMIETKSGTCIGLGGGVEGKEYHTAGDPCIRLVTFCIVTTIACDTYGSYQSWLALLMV